nr:phosphatase PAP2 family protein [Polymorphobacter sp.]
MTDLLARIEAADIAIANATAFIDETPVGRLFGMLGGVGNQPPMRALCGAVIVSGAGRRDWRLAGTGLRMLAAHSLATWLKTLVKDRVDRTRPSLLVERGEYEARPGDSDEHDRTSFPSGHTAGVTAIATVFVRSYPRHRIAVAGAATFVALVQIPRRAHFASDIAAGVVIGLAGAAIVERLWPSFGPANPRGRRAR